MNSELIQKLGWALLGQCRVDSGQMMLIDPCYILNKKDYEELIRSRKELGFMNPIWFKNGLVSNTWCGDGNYHVYMQKDKDGRVERLLIDFTTTFGFDDENPNYHDIDMKELVKKIWEKEFPEAET